MVNISKQHAIYFANITILCNINLKALSHKSQPLMEQKYNDNKIRNV